MSDSKLTRNNKEDLLKSGLSAKTIERYRFVSISKQEATDLLGFNAPSPGWMIPYPNSTFLKFKPDKPMHPDAKYLSPKDTSQELFITYLAAAAHAELSEPYYFCEGEKKCLALEQAGYAAIGISGVWNWKSKGHLNEQLLQINLAGRECYIIYDSDKYKNKHVLDAEKRLAEALVSLGARVKIVNLDSEFGKGADDQLVKLGRMKFATYIREAKDYQPELKSGPLILPPMKLTDFLKKDIPPIEYYVTGVLQKGGRTMICAKYGVGKSIFIQNLALALASGQPTFLGKFEVERCRVLYLDLEMGESALKDRFQKLCSNDSMGVPDLFVRYLSGLDLLDEHFQQTLEGWLDKFKIDVLIMDPLGHAWSGDENDNQQVRLLTAYLDKLRAEHGIAIIVAHHWRKATNAFKSGGEMAAGSYRWGAWLDHQITLEGDMEITVACTKSRNSRRFEPFLVKLNDETLCVEFVRDFAKKFTQETLRDAFESFGADRVSIPALVAYVEEKKICSGNTLRKLIKASKEFTIDDTQKTYYLVRKSGCPDAEHDS